MIHVLRFGPELFPAPNTSCHHDTVAALGDRWRIVNERVPLMAPDLRLRSPEDFPFRLFVHEIENSAWTTVR
jgi:hypothetical protein